LHQQVRDQQWPLHHLPVHDGALYSHRSTTLHAYAVALPDAFDCSTRDSILPVVSMFHGNAWGLPYVACMVGAKSEREAK
jgi:hypothetical protein